MKSIPLLFFCSQLAFFTLSGQSAAPDKNIVMACFQHQQFEEAVNYLTPVVSMDSANPQWLGLLGYAHYMNDNFTDAKKYFQRVIHIDSTDITANQYLAIMYTNNDPAVALQYTRRLVLLQPRKALFYRNLAGLFKRLNQKDSALIYYQQAYVLSPNDYKNGAALADMLIENKNYATADSILGAGLTKDSINTILLKLRIRSAYEAKDYQQAVLPGERLIRLGDISQSALTQLAVSYYNLSRYQDCINTCEYMLNNQLEAESIFYYEARSWAKLKNFTESNELLHICLSKAISKTAELYYYNLGDNYETLQQFSTATKQYDTAFYLFKNPLMKYYAARVYETHLRNEKLARKYFMQYLSLATPETAGEKKAYEYIRSKYGKKKSPSIKH